MAGLSYISIQIALRSGFQTFCHDTGRARTMSGGKVKKTQFVDTFWISHSHAQSTMLVIEQNDMYNFMKVFPVSYFLLWEHSFDLESQPLLAG